ncbi:hypothetical protein HOY82DRAFT_541919 [Tuber indicum]|nr:hypothetical protein HOY82DRAFT_541919 [Tuber indicum]
MQDLYNELWGKQLPVIEERTFSIPQPKYGFHLGYKANLKEVDKLFPDPKFEKGKVEKVFKFERIENELSTVKSKKWSDINTKTGKPAWHLNLDYQMAGQPGSGKLFFLSYLLVRRLLAGQPTVFRSNDSHCYLFDSNSNGSKTDANSLFDLPEDRKRALWILTDEALTDGVWNDSHSWFVVLAASPAKMKASRQWEKDRNVASRYMTNWGWDEIVAAFCIANGEPPTPRQIAMLFTTFNYLGPIARTCLQSISVMDNDAYNHTLDKYLGEVDREIITFLTQAIMHPTHNRRSYNPRIITRWIAHKVFKKAQMQSQLKCFELYKQLAHQRWLHPSAGWIFEAYAHNWSQSGGSFEADQLPIEDNNTPPLKFKIYRSESLNCFPDAKNLATLVRVEGGLGIERDVIRKYFFPFATNFELVDGLVFSGLDTLILLQITIAKSHDIKLCGVKQLCESIPATIKNIYLVFVILEDCTSEYSHTQSVPEAGDVKPGAADLTINQFRLVLTEDAMRSMVTWGPSQVQEEDGSGDESVSGGYDEDEDDTAMGGTQ